jgi:hypothetical protein
MRYEIYAIADAECSTIHPDVIEATDDLATARRRAADISGRHCYGTAILDTMTRRIDFGRGFGVPIPDLF